jgi:hypothetical protein
MVEYGGVGAAILTVSGPETQDHRISAPGGEVERFAVYVRDREIGRRVTYLDPVF